jgi:DNA end-binding protein Ku
VRAYELDSGRRIVVTDEELASVAPEMSRDIELRRFVPFDQIPVTYYDRPYFLAPSGKSTKAYHLLVQTMERAGRAGIGSFVMRGHEYLVAIIADGGVLRAETLRFADELRTPEDLGLPKRGKASAKKTAGYAKQIKKLRQASLDMDELEDRYAEKIEALAGDKQKKGIDVVEPPAEGEDESGEGAEVVDLMSLLKRRLSGDVRVTSADAGRGRAADGKLEDLTRAALYERAQTMKVPGRSRMDKKELVAAIRKAA